MNIELLYFHKDFLPEIDGSTTFWYVYSAAEVVGGTTAGGMTMSPEMWLSFKGMSSERYRE